MAVSAISTVFRHLNSSRSELSRKIQEIKKCLKLDPTYPREILEMVEVELNKVNGKIYRLIYRACRATQKNPPLYLQNRRLRTRGTPDNDARIVVCLGEVCIAVCIARYGGSSAVIGKLGSDRSGDLLLNYVARQHVDIYGVRRNINTALAWEDLDMDIIGQANIFHCGSNCLINECSRSTQMAALSLARGLRKLISYDPNLKLPLWPSEDAARSGVMSVWDRADIIKISKDELIFLIGADDHYNDDAVMDKLFHPGMKVLIVTEGSAGCKYFTRNFRGRVDGPNVQISDTIGAGHVFVGAFLACLSIDNNLYQDQGRLEEALDFANVCAALTLPGIREIPAISALTNTEIADQ